MVSSIKSDINKKNKIYNSAQNPIVRGEFPRHDNLREVALFRFNRFLSTMLVLSAVASMVSYSMVVAKENSLTSVHNSTNEINFENIELQNKVDYARSFYNINNKVARVNFLKKAETVLEVKSVSTAPIMEKNKENLEIQAVAGY